MTRRDKNRICTYGPKYQMKWPLQRGDKNISTDDDVIESSSTSCCDSSWFQRAHRGSKAQKE